MKKFRLLLSMATATAVMFTACQPGGEQTGNGDPVTPTVEVTLVEGSVTASGFLATVATTDAEAAAWKVLAHGDAAPEAAVVFDEGVALALPTGGPATIQVEDLNAETDYCLYVAVKAGEQYVLSAPLCVKTAAAEVAPPTPTVQVIEWYAMADPMPLAAKGESVLLTDHEYNLPGHYLFLSGFDWSDNEEDWVYARGANLFMVDFDFANETGERYVYLTNHFYPVVATGGLSLPTTSCLLADGMSEFTVGDKTYTVVALESSTDAEGRPYGITVMSKCAMGMDINMLELNVPAVDDEGNQVVIVGQYIGALGYDFNAGGGAPAVQEVLFTFDGFGFTTFTASKEGNILKLVSQSSNGNLVLNLDLSKTNGVFNEETFMAMADSEETMLTGYFCDFEDKEFAITGGRLIFTATEQPGVYTLATGRQAGALTMEGNGIKYVVEYQDYTVTINGLPEGL
jgi:hypothetical protein